MSTIFDYTGNGTTLTFGSLKDEGSTYSYNQSAYISLISLDYGYIFDDEDTLEDYGSIRNNIPNEIESYGSISIRNTIPTFGLVSQIRADSVIKFNLGTIGGVEFALQGGSIESFGTPYIGYDITTMSGGVSKEKAIFTDIGGGSLFKIVKLDRERTTYNYNESAIVRLVSENYGFITDIEDILEDYGLVTSNISSGNTEDYKFIRFNESILPYGSLNLNSNAVTKFNLRVFGSGSIFTFVSATESTSTVLPETTELFRITGAATDIRSTSSEVGSGSIFTFVSATESISLTKDASGLFRFSGTLVEKSTDSEIGSGSIFTFVSTTESISLTKEASGLFRITGAAVEKSTDSEVGSGSLFGFSGAAERVTFSYNESAVVRPTSLDYGYIDDINNTDDDYGFITGTTPLASQREDYRFITESIIPIIPYGIIEVNGVSRTIFNLRVFGSGSIFGFSGAAESISLTKDASGLFRITGAATDIRSTSSEVGSGSLFTFVSATEAVSLAKEASGLFRFSGSLVEKSTADEVGSGSIFTFSSTTESTSSVIPETTELFRITGAATDIRSTGSEVGSGSLFSFSGAAERVAFSYNESSVVRPTTLDYGFISSFPSSQEDYGLLTGTIPLPSQRDNYGFIVDNDTSIPYGKLTFISGTTESNTENYVGSGSIFTFVSATESTSTVLPETTELFRITGAATDIRSTSSEVGSGSLFTFVSATEAVSLAKEASGLFRFSGSLVEKSTADEVGSGSIFTFSSTTESTSSVIPETTELFRITGEVVEKFGKGLYTGSGSLFGFSGAAERVTFSYNESSVVINITEFLEYGYIGDVYTIDDDYGFITGTTPLASQREDYRFILSEIITNLPYGQIDLSGIATNIKKTDSYAGSGSLFAIVKSDVVPTSSYTGSGNIKLSGKLKESTTPAPHIGSGSIFTFVSATESTSTVLPETTELFRITGAAVEKFGKGIYTASGSLFGFSGAAESISLIKDASGLFRFSGIVVEKSTDSEVGSGSLFTFVSAAESISLTKEASGLFRFSGTLVEKSTDSEVGSGSILISGESSTTPSPKQTGDGVITVFGSSLESITPGTHIGSGSAFTFLNRIIFDSSGKQRYASVTESTSFIPPVDGTELRISGEVRIFFQYIEFGSGTIKISGDALAQPSAKHIGSGKLQVSGSSKESTTPAPHIGSGSIFTFVSATESTSTVLPETTELFRITGAAVEKSTDSEVGSSELRITGEAIIFIRPLHLGSGRITIDIFGEESTTPAPHIGSGSIFTFVSATESTSTVLPETTELFRFSGTAVEKSTDSEVGSSELRITGEAIIFIRPLHLGSGRITINIFGEESTTPAPHIGSGSIFTFVSATESTSTVLPETTELFRITGAATDIRSTSSEVGSGSLFGFSGAAESISLTKEASGLFRFSGTANESFTRGLYIGSGLINEFSYKAITDPSGKVRFVSADESITSIPKIEGGLINLDVRSLESAVYPNIGSGTIFGFVSKTETKTSAEKSIGLFRVSGKSRERFNNSYEGSGSIFTFVSATESTSTVLPETTELFRITGAATESISPSTEIGYIFTQIDVFSTEKSSSSETQFVEINTTGKVVERTLFAHIGSGTLKKLSSATVVEVNIYTVTKILLRLFGSAGESFIRSKYDGFGQISISIQSEDIKVDFDPPKPSQIYII